MMLYKARILQKNNSFSGELMRGRVIEYQLDGYVTDGKAAYALNQKIKEYNQKHNLSIPSVSAENYFVSAKIPIKTINAKTKRDFERRRTSGF